MVKYYGSDLRVSSGVCILPLTDTNERAAGAREEHHGHSGADVLQGHGLPAHQLRLGALHGHA